MLGQRGKSRFRSDSGQAAAVDKQGNGRSRNHVLDQRHVAFGAGEAASHHRRARMRFVLRMALDAILFERHSNGGRLGNAQRDSGPVGGIRLYVPRAHARGGFRGKHAGARIGPIAHHQLARAARVLVHVGTQTRNEPLYG